MRILVVTGASGGHIFPALGFLDTLKEKNKQIQAVLVLPRKSIIGQKQKFQCPRRYISVSAVKLGCGFKNFLALFGLFKGTIESIFILLEFRPDIVVGFGSISSLPLVVIAKISGIKTLIHEQNVIPGRANRFLAGFSDKVAVSFAQTGDYFKHCQKKIVLTGNPVRKELVRIDKNKALDFFGFSGDRFTILVFGGSLGSRRINACFVKAISKIPDKFRPRLQIIHLTGFKDSGFLKDSYQSLDIKASVFKFLDTMQYAYSASDLAVCRAGAATIAELSFFGLPAIIIPYPYAYKHQLSNAQILEKRRAAVIINEDALNEDVLSAALLEAAANPDKIKTMRLGYEGFLKTDANSLFLESVLSLN